MAKLDFRARAIHVKPSDKVPGLTQGGLGPLHAFPQHFSLRYPAKTDTLDEDYTKAEASLRQAGDRQAAPGQQLAGVAQ